MSNNSVSQIGGNTFVVSTGTSNYLWNDKNNNGKVDDGDLFVKTSQKQASVTTYVVGANEGLFAWGDPHLDNLAFTAEGKTAVIASLTAAFEDAKDGKLDNASLLGNIDQALATHGTRDNIMDFHSNIAVSLTDGTRVEFDVVLHGSEALTERLDVDVTDASGATRTVTFTEILASNGGAGASKAMETTNNIAEQAVKDSNSVYLFHEYKGANVMHGVLMYGTDAGTKDYAYVVDADGKLNKGFGKLTNESMAFADVFSRGHTTLVTAYQLGGFDDEKHLDELWARQVTPNKTPGKHG
jgi:hypothetical protein